MNKRIIILSILMLFIIPLANAALTDNLYTYWKFDGNMIDSTGTSNGSVYGALNDMVYGIINEGYYFSTDHYVTTNTTSGYQFDFLHNGADWSISVWVQHDTDSTDYHGIMGNTVGSDLRGIMFQLQGRNILLTVGRTAPYPTFGQTWVDALPASSTDYHHIVITYSYSTNQIKCYVDGVVQSDVYAKTNNAQAGNAGYEWLLIGGSKPSGTIRYMDGNMDELAIWNGKVLTQPEVTELYNSGSGLQYPFDTTHFKVYVRNDLTGNTISDFNVEIQGTENITSNAGAAVSSLVYGPPGTYVDMNITSAYYYPLEANHTEITTDYTTSLTPYTYPGSVSTNNPDGTYIKDNEINFTVQFSDNVDVTGSPVFEIETGTIDRNATYIDGTGTSQLIFNYTIQSGDYSNDLTYKATDSLQLNGGTIKDTYGNDLLLTLPNPSVFQASYNIKIKVGISNCTDLQNMNNALSANYFLMNDINCTDSMSWIDYPYAGCVGFCGIGTTGGGATPFSGTFDGQGHTISNVYIANSLHNNAGLFNYISNATIKNVNIRNLTVSNSAGGVVVVGSLVGYAKTTTGQENHIDNVNMTTTMMTTSDIDSMGGMIGYAYYTGGGPSCPILYTWNGNNYEFISDMSVEGRLDRKYLYPDDYLKVDGDNLKPTDDRYNVQVTEEFNEISYVDQLKLITLDHSPDVDVFNGLTRADAHTIYTVSKNTSQVVSCTDSLGNDCLSAISAKDGIFTMKPIDGITNMITLDLGDLSDAPEIKLIISYSWVDGYLVSNQTKGIQVKDNDGNWVTIMDNQDLTSRAALQKTYVLNLTDKFLTDDYSVRLVLPIHAIDYVAIDTTPQQEVILNEYEPISADLHYKGYSNVIKDITQIFFYDDLIEQTFPDPEGYFTKYGDVLPLLISTDDKFTIMNHGDEISLSFPYEEVPEGKERDFLMFEYAYYKPTTMATGKYVDPLPFTGMTKYPYNDSESYPYDAEHIAYLNEYNTRYYNGSNSGHNTNYISNVNLDITIEGDGSAVSYIGGLIGENDDDAYIDNVTVNIYLNGSNDITSLGGLVGYNPTYPIYIYNSTSSILSNGTDALAASYFGGVVGYTEGNIRCSYCYSSINLSGENKYTNIGGVIDEAHNGADISLTNNKISIYTNPDSASSEFYNIGGFINNIQTSSSDITIEDSYVYGISNVTAINTAINLINYYADYTPITLSNVYSRLNIINNSGDDIGQTCITAGLNESYAYSGVYILNNSCYDSGTQTFYGSEFLSSREMTFTSTFEGYDFINTWCRGSVSPGLRFWDECTDSTITVNLYNAWSGTLIKTVSDINVSIAVPYEFQQDVTATGTGLFYVSAGKYEVNVSNPLYQFIGSKNGTINASNNIVLNFVLVPKYQVKVIRETTGKPFDFNELMSTQTCFANETSSSKTFTPQLTPDRVSYSLTACDAAGPCAHAFDGSWDTYAMPNLSSTVTLKFNYSRDPEANSSSYLHLRTAYDTYPSINMSSFPACFALSVLQFKYLLNDSEGKMTLYCYDGATWDEMISSLNGAKAYDQIMYWNNITTSHNTTTCENKQTMTMKVETWCPKGLGFNTKDQLVVNILTNESTDISYNSTNKINCTYKYWIVTALYSDANYQRPLIPDTTDFNPYLYMIDLNPEKDLAIVIDYIIQDPTLAFKNGKIRVMTIVNNTNVIVIESLLNSEKRQQLVLVKNRVYQVYIIDADGNAFYVPGDLIADSSKTLYVSVPDIYLTRTEIDAGLQTKDVIGDQVKGTVRFRYTSTFDEPPVYVNFTIYEDDIKVISNITHSKKSYYLDVINLDPSKDVSYRLIIVPRSRYALSVDTTDTLWYGGEGIFKGWGTTINDTSSGTVRQINKTTMSIKFLVAMIVVILVLLSFTQISAVVGMVATLTVSSLFLFMGWFEYMYNPLVNAHTLPGGVLTLSGLFGLFALFTVFMFFRGNSE